MLQARLNRVSWRNLRGYKAGYLSVKRSVRRLWSGFFGIALRPWKIGENEAKIKEKGADKVKDDKLKKGCYGRMGGIIRD